eukprot:TRINITY_DN824_c0_g4_i1.p1 TRINITY_DN824_c0_g4~~TRINITY_DN824_c0_g4_i1.p1  ORF type:complete len:474 (+),score=191.03 TRINITY_DN824_c0_g4_i1:47-1468(+)
MKILNKEEKSYESSLYEEDLIQEYDIEEDEEYTKDEEEILEEILEEVLNGQLKEEDEKIIKQLNEIREQYQRILEKINIHKDILKEIKESEECYQIKSMDQLKYTNKTLVESDIKLEKMLSGLDSLIGASEDVRPLKKKLVQEIQKTISEIELIKSNELKSIQTKVEKLVNKQTPNQSTLPPLKKEDKKDVKENQTSPSPSSPSSPSSSSPFVEQTYQPLPNEITNLIQQIQQMQNQKQQEEQVEKQKLQQQHLQQKQEKEKRANELVPFFKPLQNQSCPHPEKGSSKRIKVRKIEEGEEQNGFPFPSREDWAQLKFEPKFEIKRTSNSYVISSKIPGLNVENVSVEANEGILSIMGSKYPTFEEQQYLARELIQSVKNVYLLKTLTRDQITLAFLKLASQYNFGKFSVKYQLPPNTSVEKIEATYRNGILQILLPTENNFDIKNLFSHNNFRNEVPFYGFQNKQQNNFWDFL